MSNYMSNNLTSNHQISINFHFYFFQTATMWIFKGDFPFLHFLFCQKFENSHTKSGLVRSETLFLIIIKICCFLKKGGMSRHQNWICFGTFFKKGPKLQNSAVSRGLVLDWLITLATGSATAESNSRRWQLMMTRMMLMMLMM